MTLYHSNSPLSLNSFSLSITNAHFFFSHFGLLTICSKSRLCTAFLWAFAHFFFYLLHPFSIYLHGSLPHSLLKCHIMKELLPDFITMATPYLDIHYLCFIFAHTIYHCIKKIPGFVFS